MCSGRKGPTTDRVHAHENGPRVLPDVGGRSCVRLGGTGCPRAGQVNVHQEALWNATF